MKEHRRQPAVSPLGARKYKDIKDSHPPSGRLDLPLVPDDMVIRAELEACLVPTRATIMRGRPELLALLSRLDAESLNTAELNAVISCFVRLNPKNPVVLPDAFWMLKWFNTMALKDRHADHHALVKPYCSSVLKQAS